MTQTLDAPEDSESPLARKLDLDSHEMITSNFWEQEFGESGAILRGMHGFALGEIAENTINRDDIAVDDEPITHDSVWRLKGPRAPSAIDLSRRTAVMDAMGIDRQLVYPTFGLLGMMFIFMPNAAELFGFDPAVVDRYALGRDVISAHNAWAARTTQADDGRRIRPVGIVHPQPETVSQLMADTEQALSEGVRALWLSGAQPLAGLTPGHADLDPFWKVVSDANVAVTLHIGAEGALLKSSDWYKGVPHFAPSTGSSAEFPVQPMSSSILHFAPDIFLSSMILGGVFERHPMLRFGVIECAAQWVGPMSERLDMWAEEFHRRFTGVLPLRPSEYLARNVRVTPFYFEPIDHYFDRYPAMSSVYAFSTDFPHREGGIESDRVFLERLESFGPDIRDQFFHGNGEWLLPQ